MRWINDHDLDIIRHVPMGSPAPVWGDPHVALCGSAPLHAYEEMTGTRHLPWRPNDCDIFVATTSNRAFLAVIKTFVKNYTEAVGRDAPPLAIVSVTACVVTLRIPSGKLLQFVKYAGATSIQEVLKSFDITVCRVGLVLNAHASAPGGRHIGRFVMTNNVRRHIKSGKATIARLRVGHTLRQWMRAQERANKYIARGYDVRNARSRRPVRVFPYADIDQGSVKYLARRLKKVLHLRMEKCPSQAGSSIVTRAAARIIDCAITQYCGRAMAFQESRP